MFNINPFQGAWAQCQTPYTNYASTGYNTINCGSPMFASNYGFYRRDDTNASFPAQGTADQMAFLRQMVNAVGSGAQHAAGMNDDQMNAIRQAMAFAEGGAPDKTLYEEKANEPAPAAPA
ncbi:hypothetical protein CONCODRAFT_10787, partial [Conidiobolus coronatus NRRL 28638]